MGARRVILIIFAAFFVFLPRPAAVSAQKAAAKAAQPQNRAILVRGSESIKGLPNFGRNSFSAVYGEYRLDRVSGAPAAGSGTDAALRVWMTDVALFVSPSAWTATRIAGRPAFSAVPAQGSETAAARLLLFERPFVAEGQGAEPRLWSVFVAVPAVSPENAAYERFVGPFLDRLSYFLSNARVPTDASFPAVVEW